jgi:hypothetical protein
MSLSKSSLFFQKKPTVTPIDFVVVFCGLFVSTVGKLKRLGALSHCSNSLLSVLSFMNQSLSHGHYAALEPFEHEQNC